MNQVKSKKFLVNATVALSGLLMPFLSLAQTPPPPNNGQNPDNHTLAVPFSSGMNLIFLAAGVVLAFIVFKKIQKKRLSKA
ncbi:hypothetical protein [Ferruginibacter albus]|uniref:hypothetical protein n=1 Tax=Ferruginibacter albus TaxID=2875540 RepID=UPI001CC3D58E|nr:hypothetical protein [Ferruginibacter albus]UAY51960.1 hypothetical protein K9M53_15380 [Ferruginibacter albus]